MGLAASAIRKAREAEAAAAGRARRLRCAAQARCPRFGRRLRPAASVSLAPSIGHSPIPAPSSRQDAGAEHQARRGLETSDCAWLHNRPAPFGRLYGALTHAHPCVPSTGPPLAAPGPWWRR